MKKIVLLLVGVVGLFAQGSNTVFQQVLTNSQVAAPAILMRNIGQGFHLVELALGDAAGHTCSLPADQTSGVNTVQPNISIYGQYDTVLNPFPIRLGTRVEQFQARNNAGNRYNYRIYAVGAYPYLYFSIGNWNNVDCVANAYYTGTVFANDLGNTLNFAPELGPHPMQYSIVTGTASDILTSSLVDAFSIYGIHVYSSTAQDIVLTETSLIGGGPSATILNIPNFCAGCQYSVPIGDIPIYHSHIGAKAVIATGASVTVTVWWRVD